MNQDGQNQKRIPILVSIGLPVFNGAKSLQEVLDTLLNQTFRNFELIISDNASTDETEMICLDYAAKDDRIRFFRQSKNFGAVTNFTFVLEQAKGHYFMWAACDDIRSSNFIEENLSFLETHLDFEASTSPVKFKGGNFDEQRMGDASLDGAISERLKFFFNGWHANGRFYSLIRRKTLINCSEIGKNYLAADWSIVLYLASKGKMNRLETGWVLLGKDGVSNKKNIFKISRSFPIEFIIPFWFFSRFVLNLLNTNKISSNARISISISLIEMNIRALYMSIKLACWKR